MLRFSLAREAKTAPQGSLLHQCLTIIDQIVEETRTLTSALYPNILRQAGLVEALRWLCSLGPEFMGIKVQFNTSSEHEDLDSDIAIFLYRAAAELLTNCMKHSGAKSVSLSLFENGEGLCMRVADDGRGFAYDDGDQAGLAGFGLFSIREKLLYLEGRLDIKTAPGAGAEITGFHPILGKDLGSGFQMAKKNSDQKSEVTADDLTARLRALKAERDLLRAKVAQLEEFQRQCDAEADHLRNLFNYSEDVGVYRLRTNPDDPIIARLVYINKTGRRLLGTVGNRCF